MRIATAGFRPTTGGLAAALAVSAVLLGACGGDSDEAQKKPKASQLAAAGVIDRDPYAIACGHVRDQQRWAEVTRRATVAVADHERIPRLNRLQATQSLYFAMTEICKGRPRTYEPAQAAVQAVRQGRYVADLDTP
jgi:hypothetical protein